MKLKYILLRIEVWARSLNKKWIAFLNWLLFGWFYYSVVDIFFDAYNNISNSVTVYINRNGEAKFEIVLLTVVGVLGLILLPLTFLKPMKEKYENE